MHYWIHDNNIRQSFIKTQTTILLATKPRNVVILLSFGIFNLSYSVVVQTNVNIVAKKYLFFVSVYYMFQQCLWVLLLCSYKTYWHTQFDVFQDKYSVADAEFEIRGVHRVKKERVSCKSAMGKGSGGVPHQTWRQFWKFQIKLCNLVTF